MRLKVVVHPAEEGGFWAEAPALKGCFSQGETLEETLANVKESASAWLEVAEGLGVNAESARVEVIEV